MKAILSYTLTATTTLVQLPFVKQSLIVSFLLFCSLLTFSQELVKDINRNENAMLNEYKEAVDVNNVLYVLIDSKDGLEYNNKIILGTFLGKGSYILKINEENKSSIRRIIKN